ncbi:hypothetical protein [Streptomyces sp. NBC_00076]|uniref:hypothetical protein n=1 Tax=Streptomyces sp. NBC_00076 TaxID=2975642 RepID=UPI003249240E
MPGEFVGDVKQTEQHNVLRQVLWTPGVSAAEIARRSRHPPGIMAQSMDRLSGTQVTRNK